MVMKTMRIILKLPYLHLQTFWKTGKVQKSAYEFHREETFNIRNLWVQLERFLQNSHAKFWRKENFVWHENLQPTSLQQKK